MSERSIPLDGPTAPRPADRPVGYELSVIAPTFMESANVERLVAALRAALGALRWQVIFVDDASPDGTAETIKALAADDARVSCLRRVGRRGLAGAVMEGALASAAPFVLVMDADGQHDAALIPAMLMRLRGGQADVVVASRYLADASAADGLGAARLRMSHVANRLAARLCGLALSDPMSGFFMARREVFDAVATQVQPGGFKVLFDLLTASRTPLRVEEIALLFAPRTSGGSKLDRRVMLEYLCLLAARASGSLISPRLLLYALIGASGMAVHFAILWPILAWGRLGFGSANLLGAVAAMGSNYLLNNEITYRDRRRRGRRLATGLLRYALFCAAGLLINLTVALQLRTWTGAWWVGGAGGALAGAAWNYTAASLSVW